MSLVFVEGFDDGLYGFKWVWNMGTSTGRTGPTAMRVPTGNVYSATHIFDAGQVTTTMAIGFAMRPNGGGVGLQFFNVSDPGSQGLVIALTNNNAISVSRGQQFSTQTWLGQSAPNSFTPNVWQYFEMLYTMNATTGAVTLRLDGFPILTLTNVNTGTVTIDRMSFYVSFAAITMDIDDVYVCNSNGSYNNGLIGDCSVETLYPNGNGNYSQFVGSDADSTDNYLLVDEAGSPVTTDYVGSGTDGALDTYAFSNLAHTSGFVRGVQVSAYAAKSDTGTRSMSNVVRSGGVDSVQAAQGLSTAYKPLRNIVEQDPNGAVDWTIASVNAAEFGVQVGAP